MPKPLLDFLGYKFFFWSNENEETPHIHVCKGKQTSNATKFSLTILRKKGCYPDYRDNSLKNSSSERICIVCPSAISRRAFFSLEVPSPAPFTRKSVNIVTLS